MKIKLFATDIDGTLTTSRSSTIFCLEVIEKLQQLEQKGVKVTLVSSNALPIVVGLRKYLGLSGPAIGETGSLIYWDSDTIIHLTKYSAMNALNDVLKVFNKYVTGSWQNMFRIYDYAVKIREKYLEKAREIYNEIRSYVENKYDYVRVGYSGYAIHLTPKDVDKGKALKYIVEKMGLDREEVVCIGDSIMDLDFIKECGVGVAVSNADNELKKHVNIVVEKPSCYGVIELIKDILANRLP